MSDDGLYYDSGDDDYFDVLYNADPGPELADDLAERAVHSPMWHENHADELRHYFSDHEYWSDDYWDDDPKLLNSATGEGDPSGANGEGSKRPAKRGRKRKLSEAKERPSTTSKETRSLQATIKGTVWKAESPELVDDYRGGSDQPVALRLNDNIMRSAYNKKQGFGKGRLKMDESWANDLSLADMGLRTERRLSTQQNARLDDEDEADENDDDVPSNVEKLAMEEEDMLDSDEDAAALLAGKVCSPEIEVLIASNRSQTAGKVEDEKQPSKKRRKITTSLEDGKDHVLPTPNAWLALEVSETPMEVEKGFAPQPAKRGRGRPNKASSEAIVQPNEPSKELAEPKGTTGRKRKASLDSDAAASTASSRVKRVASEKVSSMSNSASKQDEIARTTRSRNKR